MSKETNTLLKDPPNCRTQPLIRLLSSTVALAHLSNDTVRFTSFFVYNGAGSSRATAGPGKTLSQGPITLPNSVS